MQMYTKMSFVLVYVFKWLVISIAWKLFHWNDLTDIYGDRKTSFFCENASLLAREKKKTQQLFCQVIMKFMVYFKLAC